MDWSTEWKGSADSGSRTHDIRLETSDDNHFTISARGVVCATALSSLRESVGENACSTSSLEIVEGTAASSPSGGFEVPWRFRRANDLVKRTVDDAASLHEFFGTDQPIRVGLARLSLSSQDQESHECQKDQDASSCLNE